MTAAAQAAPSRAEINRRNAQRSTGPRSAAGKQRVKFNALKHGMRAKTSVLPGEDEALFRARLDAWTVDLQPRDEVERFLVARAVELSWKLDRVGRIVEGRRAAVRHADADRLAAEAEDVVALGRRLFWDPVGPLCLYPHAAPAGGEVQRVSYSGLPDDPDDPARIVVRLEATALGCAWLLERWDELRDILEAGLSWQPHDRLKAVRMLGRQPLDAVDDPRVMAIYLSHWAMEPDGQHEFTDLINELTPEERGVCMDRINARDPDGKMVPRSPEAARATLLALIVEEQERLEGVLAGHLERAEAEATAEEAFDDSTSGERLRRYEAENDRALLRILETLRKRRAADGTASPGGRASMRAGSTPSQTPIDVAPEADGPIQALGEPIVLDAPGVADGALAGDIVGEPAPSDGPGRNPAPTEVRPPGEPDAGPDGPALVVADGDRPASIGRDAGNSAGATSPAATPARMLAGAVLALFALLVFAGFAPASDGGRQARPESPIGCLVRGIGSVATGVLDVVAEGAAGVGFTGPRPRGSGGDTSEAPSTTR
jgi:hypothetical protein